MILHHHFTLGGNLKAEITTPRRLLVVTLRVGRSEIKAETILGYH